MATEMAGTERAMSSLMLDGETIAAHLRDEPEIKRASTAALTVRLALRTFTTLLIAVLTAGLWPLYLLLSVVYGWPPNVPRLRQALRYLRLAWSVRPPAPGLSFLERSWLTLSVLKACATIPGRSGRNGIRAK